MTPGKIVTNSIWLKTTKNIQMNYRLFFIIAASTVIFSSCKKYLEADSPSNFIDEEVFSNETDAKKAVNMVYALFNQDLHQGCPTILPAILM